MDNNYLKNWVKISIIHLDEQMKSDYIFICTILCKYRVNLAGG